MADDFVALRRVQEANRFRRKDGLVLEVVGRNASLDSAAHPKLEEMFEFDSFMILRSTRTGSFVVVPTCEVETIGGDYEAMDDV